MQKTLTLSDVPADFPITAGLSGLGGANEKYSAKFNDGHFYVLGTSPHDRVAQFLACIELVDGYTSKCERKAAKHPNLTMAQVLNGYFDAARAAHVDLSIAQVEWIFGEVARRLGSPERETQTAASGSQGSAEI